MQYLDETGFKTLIKLIKTKLVAKSRLNNNSILKYVYGDIQEALPDEDYVKPVHYHTNAQLTNYNWFSYSSTAPTNTNLLWIDPKEGLKYHNGSTWVIVPIGFYESTDATVTTHTLSGGDNIGSVTVDGVATTLPAAIGGGGQVVIKSSSYNSNSYTMNPNFSISTTYQTSNTTGTSAVKTISFTMPAYNLTIGFTKKAVAATTYTITFGAGVAGVSQNTSGTLYETITSGTSVPPGTKLNATYKTTSVCTKDICSNNLCLSQSCGQSVSAMSVVEPTAVGSTTYTYKLYLTNDDTGEKTLTTTTTSQIINFTMPEYNCTVSITRTTGTCTNMM